MSDVRAILVSREQRLAVRHKLDGLPWTTAEVEALNALVSGFDAAGDQPRIRWCVNPRHVREAEDDASLLVCFDDRCWFGNNVENHEIPVCRVVDAIVCVLEDAS